MRPGLDTPITYAAPIRGSADLVRAGAGLVWNAAPETTGGDTFKLQVPYSAAGNARPTLGVSIQLEPWGDSTRISVVAHAPADLARRPGARENLGVQLAALVAELATGTEAARLQAGGSMAIPERRLGQGTVNGGVRTAAAPLEA